MSRFALWLGAATVSVLGDAVTAFALSWTAAGFGAAAAGWVMAVDGVPLVVLMLVGGVVADRCGIRRTMIGCDAAMALVMGLFAVLVVLAGGAPLWSLFALAVVSATAAALRRPGEGVFPRLFGTGPELERRMALVGSTQQVARIAGPGLGGVLLGAGGLALTSGLDAVSFVVVLAALVAVRPPEERAAAEPRESVWGSLVAGVTEAGHTPGVVPIVVVVACLAAAVLPLVVLCLPLLARERGWGVTTTGAVTAAWTIGGLAVNLVVSRRGAPRRRLALAGPPLASVGVLLLGAVPEPVGGPVVGVIAMTLVGVGTSLLTTHLMPMMARLAPAEKLARFWSLLQLAQTLPTTVLMPVLGVAAAAGAGVPLLVVAALLLATMLAAWRFPVGGEVSPGRPDRRRTCPGDTPGSTARS